MVCVDFRNQTTLEYAKDLRRLNQLKEQEKAERALHKMREKETETETEGDGDELFVRVDVGGAPSANAGQAGRKARFKSARVVPT